MPDLLHEMFAQLQSPRRQLGTQPTSAVPAPVAVSPEAEPAPPRPTDPLQQMYAKIRPAKPTPAPTATQASPPAIAVPTVSDVANDWLHRVAAAHANKR